MKRLVALSVVLLYTTGCAALFGSSNKSILLTSEPTGAEVLINGQTYGKTPLSVNLRQKDTYAITFRSAGYQDRAFGVNNHVPAGWIILDVLFGIFPVVIDAATGSWYALNDDAVHGTLPAERIPATTDSVAVPASQSNPPGSSAREEAKIMRPRTGAPMVSGAPITVGLTDGSVLPARMIEPNGGGIFKITLLNGAQKYVDAVNIKSVVDGDGADRTKEAIDQGKRLPRD